MQFRLKKVIFFIYTISLLFLTVSAGDSSPSFSTTVPSMIEYSKDDTFFRIFIAVTSVLWVPIIIICTRRKAQTPGEVSQEPMMLRPGRRRTKKGTEKVPQKVSPSRNTTYWNERKSEKKSEKPEKKLKTEEYLEEEDPNPVCIVEDIWAEEGRSPGAKTPLKFGEKKQKITKETPAQKSTKPVSTTAKTPLVEKKQKTNFVTEMKFTNKGPINFKTHYTVQADVMISLKREPKVKISTVKWDTAPVDFYEIGLEVDRMEMLTPSTRGSNGSSSCRTASIKEMSLKK
ncbi:unnamed protein product [Caenorhabditis brenneri]